jgi:hypothetical protein
VEIAIALPLMSFIAGTIGLVATLTVPRERRGPWLGITIAMVGAGMLGFFIVLSMVFG